MLLTKYSHAKKKKKEVLVFVIPLRINHLQASYKLTCPILKSFLNTLLSVFFFFSLLLTSLPCATDPLHFCITINSKKRRKSKGECINSKKKKIIRLNYLPIGFCKGFLYVSHIPDPKGNSVTIH